jgi:hypothetical protein
VGWWLTPRPGRFTPEKETLYLSYRRLVGSEGRSGRVRKTSPPAGFDPRTFHLVGSRRSVTCECWVRSQVRMGFVVGKVALRWGFLRTPPLGVTTSLPKSSLFALCWFQDKLAKPGTFQKAVLFQKYVGLDRRVISISV